MEDTKVLHPSINQVVPHPENFLEISIINEIYHNIEQIDYKCRGQVGDDIVNLRIRQMAYSKILVNVYGKPAQILAKSLTNLGIAYFDISYFEQATEHIFQAFKLIQNTNDDMSVGEKEFQIKVLINLSKCYMEIDKLPASLSICQKCLELNQKIFGAKHVSNADIYYVLAKINVKMRNYPVAIDHLTTMHQIYEGEYGYDLEKSAKIYMELGQIYEIDKDINTAIDNYKNSYGLWENILKEKEQVEVLINLALKLGDLFAKVGNYNDASEILRNTKNNFSRYFIDKKKLHIKFIRLILNYSQDNKDDIMHLEELLELERVLTENYGEYHKSLAKNSIAIGFSYLKLDNREQAKIYFDKAEKMFVICGHLRDAREIQARRNEIFG